METPAVVTALLGKRSDIQRQIAELERQVRKHKADTLQLDAAIRLFSPSLALGKRETTRFARSAHFVTGELTRRVQDGLREAKGPITSDDLARMAMRDKGLDEADDAMRKDIARRFQWTLMRLLPRGAVVKVGYGADATWSLPMGDKLL